MPYRLFHDFFPELAERETRSITILPGSEFGLPADDYGFLEMYCDEPGCDCRRVFLYVVAKHRKGPQAVVAWGWEDLDFYAKWFKYGDQQDAMEIKGPILNQASPRTELSPAILELVREVLLKDPIYVERTKKHYQMFRERVDGKAGSGHRKKKRR
ncbi:MAG: hypothetical protein QME74_11700 [Candidatus Edwardsbacteria bacterium]|nr:hypothetical protein [Candidatus Edwardsbacteria bacterium]